jgi:predicted RNA binding protein YcfA (HicA-like mRNA interferase family)
MPRLVDSKSLEALLNELPNQFTMQELKAYCSKYKMTVATVIRHGKKREIFVNLEHGVYSRLRKEPEAPIEVSETIRHLGFVAQGGNTGAFPLPVFHHVVVHAQRILVDNPAVPSTLQKSLATLEEEVLQLRIDLADLLAEGTTRDSKLPAHPKPTTPRELKELAEAYGWKYTRQSGSHHIYKHPGRHDPLAIPCANSNKSIGARASRLIATQILRGTKGQK